MIKEIRWQKQIVAISKVSDRRPTKGGVWQENESTILVKLSLQSSIQHNQLPRLFSIFNSSFIKTGRQILSVTSSLLIYHTGVTFCIVIKKSLSQLNASIPQEVRGVWIVLQLSEESSNRRGGGEGGDLISIHLLFSGCCLTVWPLQRPTVTFNLET